MVCSKFYFSALQISLTLLGIAFFKNILTFFLENAILPCNHTVKHGHCYSLESRNVNLLCPPFHSICLYKHTLYKYFPRCGPIFFSIFQFFTFFASRQAKVTENISSNVTMFSLLPIFKMVDNRDSKSLSVK